MNPEKREYRALTHFIARVYLLSDAGGGCWIWCATRDRKGYGYLSYRHDNVRAHRFSYERFVGPIPNNLDLDHLCRNPTCVRPDHLEPVTVRENNLRGIGFAAQNFVKTHCLRGHEFTEANTQWKRGHRICLECRKIYNKETYARNYSRAVFGTA